MSDEVKKPGNPIHKDTGWYVEAEVGESDVNRSLNALEMFLRERMNAAWKEAEATNGASVAQEALGMTISLGSFFFMWLAKMPEDAQEAVMAQATDGAEQLARQEAAYAAKKAKEPKA